MAVIISRRSSYCPNFATAPSDAAGGEIMDDIDQVPKITTVLLQTGIPDK